MYVQIVLFYIDFLVLPIMEAILLASLHYKSVNSVHVITVSEEAD